MRKLITAGLLAAVLSACAGNGGGSAPSPYGGGSAPVAPVGGAATAAPKAAPLATPMPSGNPDVDNYGY